MQFHRALKSPLVCTDGLARGIESVGMNDGVNLRIQRVAYAYTGAFRDSDLRTFAVRIEIECHRIRIRNWRSRATLHRK